MYRCYRLATKTLKMYNRLSRKFKVLGIFAGLIGLIFFLFTYSIGIFGLIFGLLFIVLGVYLFVDNVSIASDEEVIRWAKRQEIDETEEDDLEQKVES